MRAPGDPGVEYRFYRFLPAKVKILDEMAIGDGIFVFAEVERNAPES